MDALDAPKLGMRFKEYFNEAVHGKCLRPVDWGSGIWQRVLSVYSVRKEFVHVIPSISHGRLLTPVEEADTAIEVLRDGIKAVCDLTGNPLIPPGLRTTQTRVGMEAKRALERWRIAVCCGTASHKMIRWRCESRSITEAKSTFVRSLPPGTPHGILLDRLVQRLNVQVDTVRAYRGSELLEERHPNIRS